MASPISSGAGSGRPAQASARGGGQLAEEGVVLVHGVRVAPQGPIERVGLAFGQPERGELPAQRLVGIAVLADELLDRRQARSRPVRRFVSSVS